MPDAPPATRVDDTLTKVPAGASSVGHADHHDSSELPKPWNLTPGRAALIGSLFLLVMIGLFSATYLPQRARDQALAEATATAVAHRPRVLIAKPQAGEATQTVILPGTLSPAQESTLFARATGYVTSWRKDLGDVVRAGELLAVISSPDLDAQLAQAQADVLQAQAQLAQGQSNVVLARISLQRQKDLGPRMTPQQSIDEAQAAYDTAVATAQLDAAAIVADRAAAQHLQELAGFEHVIAPFDGIVTSRTIQVGNLINGAAAAGSGQALYQVTQIDPLLVFLAVPQTQAAAMTTGAKATLTVRGFGATLFTGAITRISHRLDDAAHTMAIEIELPNHDHRLMPGMYATVSMHVPIAAPLLTIPSSALILGADGPTAAVLTQEDRVHLQPVVIDTDTGTSLSISAGITIADRVVLNAGESIAEGVQVEVVKPDADKPAPGHQ